MEDAQQFTEKDKDRRDGTWWRGNEDVDEIGT